MRHVFFFFFFFKLAILSTINVILWQGAVYFGSVEQWMEKGWGMVARMHTAGTNADVKRRRYHIGFCVTVYRIAPFPFKYFC